MNANSKYNGLRISQRKDIISEIDIPVSDSSFRTWRKRKSLLNDVNFDRMIADLYENKSFFSKSIVDFEKINLTQSQKQNIVNEPWLDKFYSIINNYSDEAIELKQVDTSFMFRFFLQHAKKIFISLSNQNKLISQEVIICLLTNLNQEMTDISNKTITQDMHLFKESHALKGDTPAERFQCYLFTRFNTPNCSADFYSLYPELLHILIDRLNYFIENSKIMFQRIEKDLHDIQSVFNTTTEQIERISEYKGDSHDKGNRVQILQFSDGTKVVYKPKEHAKSYGKIDRLLSFLNSTYNSNIFIVPKLVRENYLYETFIENTPVKNKSEIESYYKNYGQLIAVAYILNASDLHFENVIAHGNFPVVIDTETFFQQKSPLYFGENATVESKLKYLDSIMVTGLVPYNALASRNTSKNSINLSALKSKPQKSPFKILQVSNSFTDEMKYEYQDFTIDVKNNIPIFKNTSYGVTGYESFIHAGLQEILNNILINKNPLINYINNIDTLVVRNVIRPTQNYSDMLSFSFHGNAMMCAPEREKVLHNIWAYNYIDKRPIAYEFTQLMQGDIPQFFNQITEKSLISSGGDVIHNFYETTAKEKVLQKIDCLNTLNIKEQLVYLNTSLNVYDRYSSLKNKKNSSNNLPVNKNRILSATQKISNAILTRAIEHKGTKTINWLDVRMQLDWVYTCLDNNLYDGLPGLYLFYSALSYMDNKNNYSTIMNKIKNTMYTLPSTIQANAFLGKASLIYPLLVDYKLNKNQNSLNTAIEIANHIMPTIEKDSHIEIKNDWITGANSLVKVFHNLFLITKKGDYEIFAKKLLYMIPNNQSSVSGFAHGISSSIYLHSLIQNNDISKLMTIENEQYNNDKHNWGINAAYYDSWCKGNIGILLYRTSSNLEYPKSVKEYLLNTNLADDCLCHGEAGLAEIFLQIDNKENTNISQSSISKILTHIEDGRANIQGPDILPALGFFTGLSGIAYELLRFEDQNIPNVLLLDI